MKRRGGPLPDIVVRIYDEGWQRWRLLGGSTARLEVQTTDEGAGRTVLAVPARQVIATPLWIEGEDSALAAETVKLELEVRGLLPRAQGMDGVTTRLYPQEGRSLAVVAAFPPELPEGMAPGDVYDASPFLLNLPADAVTLWREGEDLVAAFTRGADVVYWETIDRTADSVQLRTWLSVLGLRLRSEGIIDWPLVVASWVEGLPAARVAPAGCEVLSAAPGVEPSLKHARFDWKPVSAQRAEAQRMRRDQIKRVVMIVAACYLVVAAGLMIYFGALRWKISRLAAETARLNAEVATFQPIARDWTMIAPTAEPEQFPLEILSGVVAGMPPQGIRLIRFKIDGGTVGVEGEADTFQMATDFYNALATAESFRGFNLQSDTPQMKANNSASFNIHGAIPPP